MNEGVQVKVFRDISVIWQPIRSFQLSCPDVQKYLAEVDDWREMPHPLAGRRMVIWMSFE